MPAHPNFSPSGRSLLEPRKHLLLALADGRSGLVVITRHKLILEPLLGASRLASANSIASGARDLLHTGVFPVGARAQGNSIPSRRGAAPSPGQRRHASTRRRTRYASPSGACGLDHVEPHVHTVESHNQNLEAAPRATATSLANGVNAQRRGTRSGLGSGYQARRRYTVVSS